MSSLISSSTGWDETRCQISEIAEFKLPQFVDDFITYILAMPGIAKGIDGQNT